jgi:arylsulfatase A-like enzyme
MQSTAAAGLALGIGAAAQSAPPAGTPQAGRPATEAGASGTPAGGARGPNVLVIHTDQHRTACLGAYGNKEIRTPRVDALAADGVRFTNSFCPFPVCTPSRYSLLSGLYVHEHQGWHNHSTLRPGTETFASILRAAGYCTKAVGKMHFTPTYLDVGFDELELAEQDGPGRFDDDYHRYLKGLDLVDGIDIQDQRREYRDKAPREYWDTFGAMRSDLAEPHHATTWIADRAVETLERWTPSGNLLMAGFIKPHHPFDPPAPWDAAYDPEKLAVLPGWTGQPFAHDTQLNAGYFPNAKLSLPALHRIMAFYYATISQIDFHVGRMIDVLKKRGLYDSTLIVFTSDHGEYMGFHHMLLKSNHVYDPLAKVPLVIKYPGGAARGTVCDALVSNVDVAPTILKRAGCRPGARMRGADLAQEVKREIVFAESGGDSQVMARTATHKLILSRPRDKSLFYNLRADPLEMNNLYGRPEWQTEVDRLTKAAEEWLGPEPSTKPYVDENAPRIRRPNVPDLKDNHRQEMIEYFQKKMGLAQGKVSPR